MIRCIQIILLALAAAAFGCAGGQFIGSKDGSSTSNSDKDTPRPTESSEGLPGYLVDPDLLSVQIKIVESEKVVEVTGAPGAVATVEENGDVTAVVLSAWQVPDSELILSAAASAADGGRLVASLQGKARAY